MHLRAGLRKMGLRKLGHDRPEPSELMRLPQQLLGVTTCL